MMHYKLLIVCLGIVIALYGCDEIIEKDISNENVSLLAPTDSVSSDVFNHTFWWEEVEGANKYQLQIVSPSFDSIARLELDTTVSGTKFNYTIRAPGIYQWAVNARNENYETGFHIRTLIIRSDSSLVDQPVILRNPDDNTYTNDEQMIFQWDVIPNADNYTLRTAPSEHFSNPVLDTTIPANANSLTNNFEEGNYYWQVKAASENGSSTKWSAIRQFAIDQTPPQPPEVNHNVNNRSVTFSWQRDSEDQIAKDVLQVFINNSNLQIEESPFEITQPPLQKTVDSLTRGGQYTYFIYSVDRAGNEGAPTDSASFTIPLQ